MRYLHLLSAITLCLLQVGCDDSAAAPDRTTTIHLSVEADWTALVPFGQTTLSTSGDSPAFASDSYEGRIGSETIKLLRLDEHHVLFTVPLTCDDECVVEFEGDGNVFISDLLLLDAPASVSSPDKFIDEQIKVIKAQARLIQADPDLSKNDKALFSEKLDELFAALDNLPDKDKEKAVQLLIGQGAHAPETTGTRDDASAVDAHAAKLSLDDLIAILPGPCLGKGRSVYNASNCIAMSDEEDHFMCMKKVIRADKKEVAKDVVIAGLSYASFELGGPVSLLAGACFSVRAVLDAAVMATDINEQRRDEAVAERRVFNLNFAKRRQDGSVVLFESSDDAETQDNVNVGAFSAPVTGTGAAADTLEFNSDEPGLVPFAGTFHTLSADDVTRSPSATIASTVSDVLEFEKLLTKLRRLVLGQFEVAADYTPIADTMASKDERSLATRYVIVGDTSSSKVRLRRSDDVAGGKMVTFILDKSVSKEQQPFPFTFDVVYDSPVLGQIRSQVSADITNEPAGPRMMINASPLSILVSVSGRMKPGELPRNPDVGATVSVEGGFSCFPTLPGLTTLATGIVDENGSAPIIDNGQILMEKLECRRAYIFAVVHVQSPVHGDEYFGGCGSAVAVEGQMVPISAGLSPNVPYNLSKTLNVPCN